MPLEILPKKEAQYLQKREQNVNKHFVKERQKKRIKMAYTYEMLLEIPPKEEAQYLQKRK